MKKASKKKPAEKKGLTATQAAAQRRRLVKLSREIASTWAKLSGAVRKIESASDKFGDVVPRLRALRADVKKTASSARAASDAAFLAARRVVRGR